MGAGKGLHGTTGPPSDPSTSARRGDVWCGVGEVEVRQYRPADRPAVRRICFETGYMGDSISWAWPDEDSFADLFSSWYTDGEPESALVADDRGEVVGYLLGCRDSRRMPIPTAAIRRHLLRRGLAIRPRTAPLVWRSAFDLSRAAVRHQMPAAVTDDRWPAHLHIDLLPQSRGKGLGRLLMRRWLDTLRDEATAGCHLETWAENDGAIAFFASMGFRAGGDPVPMPGVRSPEGHRHHTQLMVQSLMPAEPSTPDEAAQPEARQAQPATAPRGRR